MFVYTLQTTLATILSRGNFARSRVEIARPVHRRAALPYLSASIILTTDLTVRQIVQQPVAVSYKYSYLFLCHILPKNTFQPTRMSDTTLAVTRATAVTRIPKPRRSSPLSHLPWLLPCLQPLFTRRTTSL